MLNITKYDEKLKPLYEFVKNGDCNNLKKWIEDGNPLFNPDSKTRSVVYYATTSGFFSILELLLFPGWKQYPKVLDQALHEAIAISHADCTLKTFHHILLFR